MKLKPVMDAFERSPGTVELAGRLPARGTALELAGLAFASGALGDLRGPFLWLALALGLGEMALAAGRRRDR